MIQVTEDFKNAARAPVKTIRAAIVCGDDYYTSDDVLVSFTKEDAGFYFGATTKCLSFKLLGTNYNLVGKNVAAGFDIQNGNTWENCEFGQFTVYEQTVNLEKGTTDFKAYDPIGLMGKTNYEVGSINFPCTVENLFRQIGTRFGLTIIPTNVPNANYSITEDL